MSSTITALTSGGGLAMAGDTSGQLELKTNNGTTAVTIDTSQRAAFVAGTAALPAITTTGDTNTGIYFPAADTIAFTEGGTESMRIDSSGNLLFNSGYGSVATAYGCRAWVKFTGSTGAIIGSAGVSSVTRRATGRYTVNLSFTMPDANYCITAMAMNQSYGYGTRSIVGEGNPVTTSFEIFQMQFNGAAEDSNACVAVFR